ncbi:MAG TPA: AAA family ATPase, partial [Bacillota bacterium]|nr:AAA family ATPase [Bacillota bacterium]
SVILVVPSQQLELKRAMRMGAADTLSSPFSRDEIKQALQVADQRLSLPAGQPEKYAGRIITICGTKGGIGKTTVTVNLAVTMAKYNLKVAVVDADLQFGDAAIILDLQPRKTIYEFIKECNEDYSQIGSYMIHHSSGVDLLSAPHRPEFAEEIEGADLAAILSQLQQQYDVVLVDTPPALVETSLVALEHSTDILLITSMELPTLKNSKLGMETLETLGLKERTKIILNRDSEVKGLRLESVEEILGSPIFTRIPSDGNVVVPSINQGIPFVLSHSRAAVSRSIFTLASMILGKKSMSSSSPKEAPSFLARVLGRR